MPTNHPAAERAYRKYESCFDVPEEAFIEPDLPAIVTEEYEPLVEAAEQYIKRLRQALYCLNREVRERAIAELDVYGCRWTAALRDTVGEP